MTQLGSHALPIRIYTLGDILDLGTAEHGLDPGNAGRTQ